MPPNMPPTYYIKHAPTKKRTREELDKELNRANRTILQIDPGFEVREKSMKERERRKKARRPRT